MDTVQTIKSDCEIKSKSTHTKWEVGFWGQGKTGVPGERPPGAEYRTSKLNPHITPSLVIEPGPFCLGAECSHHSAIPASSLEVRNRTECFIQNIVVICLSEDLYNIDTKRLTNTIINKGLAAWNNC